MSNILWALIAPAVISAVSWAAALYSQAPRITGSLLFVAYGEVRPGEITPDARQTVTTYVTLENQRDASVTPIKYLLEVRTPIGWQEVQYHPYYRKHDRGVSLQFDAKTLQISGGGLIEITFPTDASMLTSSLTQPIKKGETRNGLLTYLLPKDRRIEAVRVRIVDASQKEYLIEESTTRLDPRIIMRLDKDVQIRELRETP